MGYNKEIRGLNMPFEMTFYCINCQTEVPYQYSGGRFQCNIDASHVVLYHSVLVDSSGTPIDIANYNVVWKLIPIID